MTARPFVSVLLAAAAAATVLGAAGPAHAKCSALDCGSNSPYLSEFSFHELDPSGAEYNDAGLRLVALVKWWVPYQPAVFADKLLALAPNGDVVWKGDDLIGTYLLVETKADPVRQFRIDIDAVEHDLTLWVDPDGEELEAYELSWAELTGPALPHRPLCSMPPPTVVADGAEYYPNPNAALIFTGDRYDAAAKTVIADSFESARGWINVVCAGGAGYKLFMTRHTTATSTPTFKSNADERQAMLKMYVSDLCGDGRTFTYQGTPLRWTNAADWGFVTWGEYATEAYWSAKGATCLDVHRLGTQMLADIQAACGLPACDAMYPGAPAVWPSDAYVVSRLPDKPI